MVAKAPRHPQAGQLTRGPDRRGTYVLATGKTHSVRYFLERAFNEIDIQIAWRGKGVEEKGLDAKTGRMLVEIDPRYFRPTEVDLLIGDPAKAHRKLGWRHEKSVDDLCREMVREDLVTVARERRRNVE